MRNYFHRIRLFLIAISVTGSLACNVAYGVPSNEIPFTIQDRERIIRIEEQLKAQQAEMNMRFEAMQKEMNTRFEAMEKEMSTRFEAINTRFEALDDKLDKLYTLIYFVLGGVFGLIGLVFWDRRSYIKPVKEDIQMLINILKAYAKKQPDLAEVLRMHGLL